MTNEDILEELDKLIVSYQCTGMVLDTVDLEIKAKRQRRIEALKEAACIIRCGYETLEPGDKIRMNPPTPLNHENYIVLEVFDDRVLVLDSNFKQYTFKRKNVKKIGSYSEIVKIVRNLNEEE